MDRLLCDVLRSESGVSAAEYAVIAVGLALPMLAFLSVISISCGNVLSSTGPALTAIGQNGQ